MSPTIPPQNLAASPAPRSRQSVILTGIIGVAVIIGAAILYWQNSPPAEPAPQAQAPAIPAVHQGGAVSAGYGWSDKADEAAAASEAMDRMKSELGDAMPKWIMIFSTADYDADRLAQEIQKLAGAGVKMSGITSWKGVLASDSWHAGRSVAILGIASDKIAFGVGTAEIAEGKGRDAAKQAVQNAITDAGKTSAETPKIVLMNGVLGQEEDMLKGVADVVGAKTPVLGGSAGDNDISGKWKQYANGHAYGNNVVMTVIYTDLKVGYEFSTGIGYLRTDRQGVVTRAKGRTIYEIDHRPAADVYNEWLGGELDTQLASKDKQASVLQQGIIDPLAVVVNGEKGITYYLTVHPVFINLPEKSLTSLAIIEQGKSISIMRGSADAHALRPPLVIRMARAEGEIPADEVAAGVALFCACTHMVLGDAGVNAIVPSMRSAFANAPFIGAFTFGEEGPVPGVGNRHQNLVQNILIFGNK